MEWQKTMSEAKKRQYRRGMQYSVITSERCLTDREERWAFGERKLGTFRCCSSLLARYWL